MMMNHVIHSESHADDDNDYDDESSGDCGYDGDDMTIIRMLMIMIAVRPQFALENICLLSASTRVWIATQRFFLGEAVDEGTAWRWLDDGVVVGVAEGTDGQTRAANAVEELLWLIDCQIILSECMQNIQLSFFRQAIAHYIRILG